MAPDEKAIQDVLQRIEAAWNAGDGKSYAAPFAEDADYIHIYGGHIQGRQAIEDSHRHIFETVYRGSRVTFGLERIRTVQPGVSVVFSRAHLEYVERNEPRHVDSRPTLVMVKGKSGWEIMAFQNTRVADQHL